MAIYSFKNYIPKIPSTCFLAPGAQVIGNIALGNNVSIWHNSVLRGDVNQIVIGDNTNIQDLSMLHITESSPLLIGENVTVGHSVTLHGCNIGNNSLIGMGATVLDNSIIGDFSIVAAGSLVPPNKTYPPKSMIMGNPAKAVRELKDKEIEMLNKHYIYYVGYAKDFKLKVEEI